MEYAEPSVTVGLRRGRLFVISKYSPGRGTWILKEPVLEARPTDAADVGQKVLDGLDHFVAGGKMPDWNKYRSPILPAAGVKTWSEWERGLKECMVVKEPEGFKIMSEGLHATIPYSASPEALGAKVLEALKLSAYEA